MGRPHREETRPYTGAGHGYTLRTAAGGGSWNRLGGWSPHSPQDSIGTKPADRQGQGHSHGMRSQGHGAGEGAGFWAGGPECSGTTQRR